MKKTIITLMFVLCISACLSTIVTPNQAAGFSPAGTYLTDCNDNYDPNNVAPENVLL